MMLMIKNGQLAWVIAYTVTDNDVMMSEEFDTFLKEQILESVKTEEYNKMTVKQKVYLVGKIIEINSIFLPQPIRDTVENVSVSNIPEVNSQPEN